MRFAAVLLVVVIIAAAHAEDGGISEDFQCEAALAAANDKCGADPVAEQNCFECLWKNCHNHYEAENCDQLAKCVKDATDCQKKN